MPDVSLLHRLHKISTEVDVKIDYVALGHRGRGDVYEMEANRVVNLLKSAQLYDAARTFARVALLSADDVTIDQVSNALDRVWDLAKIKRVRHGGASDIGCLTLLKILEMYWNNFSLLEILEIYWKLAKSRGSFLADSKFLYFTVYQ